ncbi:unnamed protein product [Blepharisma stoltei]|uniref:Uncharacterized protein n=1 Tax=Blepharisma stoltei TaxID=1481888 RepID=A0AAU9JNH8_9CILI|nr:unnamed protein product [Blepharisma stoltei]
MYNSRYGSQKLMQNQRNAETLLEFLLDKLQEETKSECEHLGFAIEELFPLNAKEFNDKETSSKLSLPRYNHYEQKRFVKLLKVSTEICQKLEGKNPLAFAKLQNLINGINLSESLSPVKPKGSLNSVSHSVTFQSPHDVIDYCYTRERKKYNQSLRVLNNISTIKKEEFEKIQEKISQFDLKEKKIKAELQKKEEKHEKHTEIQNIKRHQHLEKKSEIEEIFKKQCGRHFLELEGKMKKLSEANKIKIREKLKDKHEEIKKKIEQDFEKIVMSEERFISESEEVEKLMKELEEKIDRRIEKYGKIVKMRIQSAREHAEKVGYIMNLSQMEEIKRQEENLKKAIAKSLTLSDKKEKKENYARETVGKTKKMIERSINRRTKSLNEKYEEENERIKNIEQRDSRKTKSQLKIQRDAKILRKEKIKKNIEKKSEQIEKYMKEMHEFDKFRDKILEKHFKMAQIADDIKNHRNQLSTITRKSNLELNMVRSEYTSPAKLNKNVA